MADDDRYLTGGGEIIPEQRSASYSTNTSIGPFSGGAILAGQEDAIPIVGGRFTTQLPEGLSATLSRTGQAGAPMEYARDAIRLAKQLEAGQLALEASRVGSEGLPSYGLQYSGQIGREGGAPSYYPQPKGHWFVEAGGTPSTPERHVRGGARFNFAEGGTVEDALHAVRHHLAGGGFLSDLFSGPDYQSTGEVASPTNWGDPDSAADFFRADKALRLAREVQAREPEAAPLRQVQERPPVEALRQQIAAPAPAPTPEQAPVNIPYAATFRPMRLQGANEMPPHLTEQPGFGQSQNTGEGNDLWANPKSGTGSYLEDYKLPAVALARQVMAQQEAIPSAAAALAAVEKLHNAGVYSGPELDKAGEILAAHNRAKADGIPVEEALRLNRLAPAPLAYASTPAPAPASAAIDAATGKLTNRVDPNSDAERAGNVWNRMLKQESGNRQFDRNGRTITSPAGALGISQVMPSTGPEAAQLAGLPWDLNRLRTDPEYNHALGRAYYDAQLARFGDPILAAAAYNGGPGRVAGALRQAQATGRPWTDFLKPETQNYVRVVGRAEGGLVDDALHVVREHHADGEAVGLEMPAEEPRPLTIYRGNAPVADEAGGSGRETVPAFSYMPMPESVERQAARQPAYNPAEGRWSDAGSTEGERLTRALGVEGELPKGETFMSPQPTGWGKYMPQRVPGTFLKRTGEAFGENADMVAEGLRAVREGNYGAGALGMVGGALGAAISPLTGMERVLVRDPYLRMTGNLKDAQAAEMAADVALTGGLRGMVKPFAKAGNLEKLAAEPVTSAYRLPSPAATGAATAAGAMLAPEDAEASKLSKAMEVARMAIPRELSPLGFYSHGAEAARGLAQAKGTPEQFAAMLQKSGVKGPEMEGFLKTFGGRPIVTQDEAAQYFKGAMPQVEETVLGGTKPDLAKSWETVDRLSNDLFDAGITEHTPIARGTYDINLYPPETRPAVEELAAAHRNIREQSDAGRTLANAPTKFNQYTLPGGENYREVLLKLPEGYGAPKQALDDLAAARQRFKDLDKRHGDELEAGLTGDMNMSYEDFDKLTRERDIAQSRVKNFEKLANQPAFQSGHWQDPNVLAHLRLADRTGPNGEKVLHVEEIQSDWGQKGKKEGFITPETTKQIESINQKITDLMGQRDNLKDQLKDLQPKISASSGYGEPLEYPEHYTVDLEVGIRKKIKNIENEVKDLRESRPTPGLPSAPYVTNTQAWTDLALKRALREAAEGGYDKLVWTPGAEQAKRYSLSNQVDRLQYIKNDDGTYAVIPYKNNRPLHQIERDNIPEKELESLFGRDVAEKMKKYEGDVDGNARSLAGQNLEVGGEGMKGYYDKIVPNQLSKLVKKLDPEAKIGTHEIRTTKESDLRRKLRDEGYDPDQIEIQELLSDNGGRAPRGFTEADLDAIERGDHFKGVSQKGVTAPSLTITPKMREAILGGQTAFADGGSVVDRALMLVSKQA